MLSQQGAAPGQRQHFLPSWSIWKLFLIFHPTIPNNPKPPPSERTGTWTPQSQGHHTHIMLGKSSGTGRW